MQARVRMPPWCSGAQDFHAQRNMKSNKREASHMALLQLQQHPLAH